jgi:hypothetical protein
MPSYVRLSVPCVYPFLTSTLLATFHVHPILLDAHILKELYVYGLPAITVV